MRKIILLLLLVSFIPIAASATEFTAPPAPEAASEYMPQQASTFQEDILYILKKAISKLQPSLADATSICVSVIAVVILTVMLKSVSETANKAVLLTGYMVIATLLLQPSDALIKLGTQTVQELSEYGKLLLPVMTAAVAAEGGMTTSATLYTGAMFFNSLLMSIIANVITPLIYINIAFAICSVITDVQVLKNLKKLSSWLSTWCLKIVIYVFTGYLSISGIISGKTDAAALKTAKLTISGFVPVVGSIMSDASETVLLSAGVMKNAAGTYGMLAIIAVVISPFLKIAIQYLLLKVTAVVCEIIGEDSGSKLINEYAAAMGLVLAMVSAMCLLLLISTVCFMKGVS